MTEVLSKELQDILSIRKFTNDFEYPKATEKYIISEETDEVTSLLYEESTNGKVSFIIEVSWNGKVKDERLYTLYVEDIISGKSGKAEFKVMHDIYDFLFKEMGFNFEELEFSTLSEKFMKYQLKYNIDFNSMYNVFIKDHNIDYDIEKLITENIRMCTLQDFIIENLIENHTAKELHDLFKCEESFEV